MLLAAVVNLKALESGAIDGDSGHAVHGLWFRRWGALDPAVAQQLHDQRRALPFTVSPLMGLPPPQHGRCSVPAGQPAWFRLTTLQSELSARLETEWLPRLPPQVELGGLRWQVLGWSTDRAQHPWAGRADPQALAEEHLLAPAPPRRWRLAFATPTAFHGQAGHLPFPLPNVLLGSWLRRWQRWGPVRLPDRLPEQARKALVVSSYTLKTVPVRQRQRLTIGCVGRLTLRAVRLHPGERAAVDLLAAFAFFCGSGHRTTQGMGLTRVLPDAGRVAQ